MNFKKDLANSPQAQVVCVATKKDGSKIMRVNFNPEVITKTDQNGKKFNEYSCSFVEIETKQNSALEIVREFMLSECQKYGDNDVNSFTINGKEEWMEYSLRGRICNAISLLKSQGVTSYTLIIGSMFTLDINVAEETMAKIENYAYQCHITTANHIAKIEKIDSMEELIGYDFTTDYPEKLTFNF